MNGFVVQTLAFEATHVRVIDVEGTPWVRGAEVGRALGYKEPAKSVSKIFKRNAAEFSEQMSILVPLFDLHGALDTDDEVGGQVGPQLEELGVITDAEGLAREGSRDIRLFSPRGAHLLAMFARTPAAVAFRRWVLDVLEHVQLQRRADALSTGHLLRLVEVNLRLLDRIAEAETQDTAEKLYLRMLEVDRRLGLPSPAFVNVAHRWRQGQLPLQERPSPGPGSPAH